MASSVVTVENYSRSIESGAITALYTRVDLCPLPQQCPVKVDCYLMRISSVTSRLVEYVFHLYVTCSLYAVRYSRLVGIGISVLSGVVSTVGLSDVLCRFCPCLLRDLTEVRCDRCGPGCSIVPR